MTKVCKKLCCLLLGLVMAVALVFGITLSLSTKQADAAETVDFTETVTIGTKAAYGDYTDAYMIRVQFEANGTSWGQSKCLNDSYPDVLKYLTINGKSIYDLRAEYAEALTAKTAKEITWTGYPSNTGSTLPMQPNIADDLTRETPRALYAPIFASLTYHASLSANCIDIYIPGTYLDPSQIETFGITKDFSWTAEDGTVYGVSDDVTFYGLGYKQAYKQVGALNITETATTVTKVQPNASSTNFFLFYLSENNYDGLNHEKGNLQTLALEQLSKLKLWNYIEVDGQTMSSIFRTNGISEIYYQVWSKADSFAFRVTSLSSDGSGTASQVKIKAGAQFPKYDASSSSLVSTTECYTVQSDLTFVNNNGTWEEVVEEIETTVTMATILYDTETDCFAGIMLEGSDYASAPATYAGTMKTALSFAQSENFLSHILIDDAALSSPSEAFLNVWRNYGYFTFRPGKTDAKKITVLKGCKFPTYNALLNGANEVYVTTEDITFVKGSDGTWAVDDGGLKAGEYDTAVSSVVYARDNENNWMMFALTDKDYPDANTTYNVATTETQISVLNLYDKIIVDNISLRERISINGTPTEAPKINLWKANCLGIRIAGCEGLLTGAQKVTVKAGAQFPSYAYITEGTEAYYVTTEDITFVNCGYSSGAWYQQYTLNFVADEETVAVQTYTDDDETLPTAPAVPEKEGYSGAWESYNFGYNGTVNAVYTKNPTVVAKTSVKEVRRIDNNSNILVINPTTNDYPASVEGSWNIGLDVSYLQKFNLLDYITINNKTLRSIGVSSMAINKFTRAGLGLETTLSDSMTVVIKKGCEIPSYAFWQNPTGEASCYVVDADYTCVYAAGGEAAFTITAENADNATAPEDTFEKNYVLSDLYNIGYEKTSVFADGMETLTDEGEVEASYRYGYVDGTSFTLSFDFKFTGATYYDTFYINLGTEGYGGTKYHFGWRFYLLRGNDTDGIVPNFCVEYFSNTSDYGGNITNSANETFGTSALVEGETYSVTIGYKLLDASTGEVQIFTSLNNYSRTNTYVLGGTFITFAPYANSLTMNTKGSATVTVCDPDRMDDSATAKFKILLKNGDNVIAEKYDNKIELPALTPAEYNMAGNVFVGWTTDLAAISDLYPAGYALTVSGDTTLYPVWIGFTMREGAGVRTVSGSSGIRFIVDVDGGVYDAGIDLGLITEIGTILAPTELLKNKPLTHGLGEGNYAESVTKNWQKADGTVRTYSSAFVNIYYDQYCRYFSARGYMKIDYTSGLGYIYTEYDEANHSRSIYQVATAAYLDETENYDENPVVQGYVNDVADVTIDSALTASKTANSVGNYTVTAATDGTTVTVNVTSGVKTAFINGTRVVMGSDAEIVIGNKTYTLSGYKLNGDGLQLSFTLGDGEELTKEYYISLLQAYIDSDAYTAVHHKMLTEKIVQPAIDEIDGSDDSAAWISAYSEAVATLATVKTAEELAKNVGTEALDKPVVGRGLGYTVTWDKVANADYYYVYDDNDYREYTVVMADETLVYETEVVGAHNVYVVAHSYYERYSSAESASIAATEVKPVFSYKSMSDGLYKFTEDQLSTMGISDNIKNSCSHYTEEAESILESDTEWYIVYYNKDTGWSPYPVMATDWTSPAEFPAHAQRLKDMGNNIIMIAYDSNGSYKAGETWQASRMRYIMDTAWSMGMKVLVCDEVFYDLSMSEEKCYKAGTCATSKAQVTTAIKERDGFAEYVTHPAFYGFSLDDEPYYEYIDAMSYTISALDEACEALGVSDPFYLACLFQSWGGDKMYTGDTLQDYYKAWLSIEGVDNQYLYVDIYTQHAMDYTMYSATNRYETSFDAVYGSDKLGGQYDFYQALTSHTQRNGTLSEQDLYMSMLYAAAHDVAGYSWFCYFPIVGELSASMVGFDGNGYGNGIGNNASGSYYNAAKTAGYQFELIQGLLDGYDWQDRKISNSDNLLETTLSNGTSTAKMYVNADEDEMSASVTVTASGSQCYLVGYGVGTAAAPYQAVSGSVTLEPGQAVICIS